MAATRDDLIEGYFHMGLSYNEIVDCLLINHDISLSLRHLKRILSGGDVGVVLMRR